MGLIEHGTTEENSIKAWFFSKGARPFMSSKRYRFTTIAGACMPPE
jgi:hypothetical protein